MSQKRIQQWISRIKRHIDMAIYRNETTNMRQRLIAKERYWEKWGDWVDIVEFEWDFPENTM